MKSRYNQLRNEIWGMPDGKQKLSLMEEAIRIADQYLTDEDAYEARMNYTSAALECGCSERLFVSFTWCLSKFEQNPGQHSNFMIMWHYKWILNQIWRLPQVSVEQIDRVFEDFKDKCLRFGYSLRPYHQQRVNYYLSHGNMQEAAMHYKSWRSAPRDSLADCKACEQNLFGKYYFDLHQNRKGLQLLKPILEGKLRCGSIPQNTYSNMFVPLLRIGEYEQAKKIAGKAIRSIEGPRYIVEYGRFLEYYTVTDMPKAVKLYERTILLGLDTKVPWDRFMYLMSVRLFLQEWLKTKRRKKLQKADLVTTAWLDEELRSLRTAFNERNGNDYFTRVMEEKQQHMKRLTAAFRKHHKQASQT